MSLSTDLATVGEKLEQLYAARGNLISFGVTLTDDASVKPFSFHIATIERVFSFFMVETLAAYLDDLLAGNDSAVSGQSRMEHESIKIELIKQQAKEAALVKELGEVAQTAAILDAEAEAAKILQDANDRLAALNLAKDILANDAATADLLAKDIESMSTEEQLKIAAVINSLVDKYRESLAKK